MKLGAFLKAIWAWKKGSSKFQKGCPDENVSIPTDCYKQFLCSPCVAQPRLLLGLPLHINGLLKLGENWAVGRDGNRSALLEQAAGDGHNLHGSLWVSHFLGGWDWQLYGSFCCLPFQKGSLWTYLCALGVSLPVRGWWDCSTNTMLCCSDSCIKGHCCCLHDVYGK